MSAGGPLRTDSYFAGKLRRDHSTVETEISKRITEKRSKVTKHVNINDTILISDPSTKRYKKICVAFSHARTHMYIYIHTHKLVDVLANCFFPGIISPTS